MSFFPRLAAKIKSLQKYYLFEKFGLPQIQGEKISKSVIKKFISNNPVMVDCGAHDGADSVELVKILGGTLYAFEPIDSIFGRLIQNTSKYKNIHCFKLALSNLNGEQFFYVSEGASDASSSLLEPQEHLTDHPDTTFSNKIKVQTVTLDDWAKQNRIPKIDLLWLDMQGFELAMLRSSKHILKQVRAIHSEVSTRETYKGVGLYKDYRAFLEEEGFKVVAEAIPANWDMGNVLFVRE